MKEKFVITIGRQFGSGGREIGIQLANMLDIEFYDRKLITEAAKRSGLSNEVFETEDEKTPGSLIHALSMGLGFGNNGFSQETIYKIQSDVIRDIASKESCVIVGRSADYVLRNEPRCVNVFIHSPKDIRVQRVTRRNKVTEKEALQTIEKIDKNRAAYYDFYTNKSWGATCSYHLSIDSSLLGISQTAEYIKEFVNQAL